MPDSNDERYAEILRRIQERRAQTASAPVQSLLAAALNDLNAAGFLENLRRRPPAGQNVYGPRTAQARAGAAPQWLASILWHKPKGYYHYQTLGLLGIWAVDLGETVQIIVGRRLLAFNAPVFNPESYYHHLRRRYDLHYPDDSAPPDETRRLLTAIYQADERLALRGQIEAALRGWVEALTGSA
ncbi:MAG: hypothetical protein JNM70_07635 [Anaerolineae bacterium]|nr:hypothetical protein [Anaerolineae bacterium]